MFSASDPVVFVSAKRTPFGTYLGSLSNITATDLGVYAARAALKESLVTSDQIDHVIFGNVLQTSVDAIYLARHVGLKSGILEATPALTVNRLCGSGFEAIIQGAQLLALDEATCVLVGGTENMSQAPHVIRGARAGLALGQSKLEDSLWECLNDTYVNLPMALTAENLAQKYAISQEEVDSYSVSSQEKYQTALREGVFNDEIEPIPCGSKKDPKILANDEHPRANTSLEGLRKLPKIFKKDGVIHAGAASGICDGAAALVMCKKSFAKDRGLKPLGELVSFGVSGCDPKIMGIGPVPAIKTALNKARIKLDQVSQIEVNEAFAPQVLAVKKELDLGSPKLNIHGGAIALGHPLAASGARITAHLLHSLKKSPGKIGIGSACIGGGQGIAVILSSLGGL